MIKHEQFVHYRALEQDPGRPQLRRSSHGGVTLFVMPFADDKVAVGVATCSPRDEFVKAKGRLASEGRIRKLRRRTLQLLQNTDDVWRFLDRVAAHHWTRACRLNGVPAPLLLRGGKTETLVAPRGSYAYPWFFPEGEEVVRAPQSDDLDSDE